jgi:adenylosuccinate lyase
MNKSTYQNPLVSRYCSNEMSGIFSDNFKFSTWRKIWLILAESQKELGLDISEEQLKEMKDNLTNIDFEHAAKMEKELRHDVMAHIHTFGQVAKKAFPIIHLGATSAFVGDNTDLIQIKEALTLTKTRLVNVINNLKNFAHKYKNLPTLGYTHYQTAQLTTVGKRAALWLQDFILDYEKLEKLIEELPARGVKGTTGTQASFLKLFEGDEEKVVKLNNLVTEKMGFKKAIPLSGQTYTRKIDDDVLHSLRQIAISCSKFANDMRLSMHDKELEEPFGKKQVGSSAMAYKRNPMRSERVNSLSRYLISLSENTAYTAATQWFERTLDDSANRRITIPQAFLTADAILLIIANVTENIVVNEKVIETNVKKELPFMATENILMEAVKKGGNRNILHEVIRTHSFSAAKKLKEGATKNPLIELLANDENMPLTIEEIENILKPDEFTGRASSQVEEFIEQFVNPIIAKNKNSLSNGVSLKV